MNNSLFSLKNNGVLISTRLKVVLALLVGLALAVTIPIIVRDRYLTSLTERVETIAVMLDSQQVIAARDDTKTASSDYQYLKDKLREARLVNDESRFVYILSRDSDGNISSVVDSEAPGTDGYTSPGEAMAEASDGLKSMFDQNEPYIEGPTSDRLGSWLSVYAPIRDTSSARPVAVVGMDIPGSTYVTTLALAAGVPLIGSLLIAAMFVMTDRIRQKRQDALRMRSELVSIASHELRTPLTGIRWGEETLMTSELAHKDRSTLMDMYDGTIRLQDSIEDILQLANVQAGRSQELQLVSTNITQMFEGIFATQKLPSAQKGIALEFGHHWPKGLVLSCDAQRMKRVFNNLISNAIKYSRPNTSVILDYEKVDGKHLITIKDHGIGIPESEQSKVFSGFYRASNAVAHEAGGTGMGLYLSRSVIEQHGGKLWLKSKEGKGTTAYIQLP